MKNVFNSVMLDILILGKKIQKELEKTDKKIAEKLDYDGIEFPVQGKDFNKIEVKNNIFINVFGYFYADLVEFMLILSVIKGVLKAMQVLTQKNIKITFLVVLLIKLFVLMISLLRKLLFIEVKMQLMNLLKQFSRSINIAEK